MFLYLIMLSIEIFFVVSIPYVIKGIIQEERAIPLVLKGIGSILYSFAGAFFCMAILGLVI